MIKKFLIVIAGFGIVVVSLFAVKFAQIKEMSSVSHVPPPTAVTTANAEAVEWRSQIDSIGTLAPVEGMMLGADADGIISKILVENGAAVKAGDIIVELDSSVEQAQLAAAQARADLARLSFERAKDLSERNANSKSDFDVADATYKQAVADTAAISAQISKKQVRAPFDGRVGIREVNLGQFVARGRALMPLQKLSPIYVNFGIPQRFLPSLAPGQEVDVKVDAFPNRIFKGKITAINSEVDAATRNISVQATLENPNEVLRSGMFARVAVEMSAAEPQVVVPATAIAYASYGNSVFIVENIKDKDGKEFLGVRQQFIKLGPARGDLVAIAEGLKAGEVIVTSGVFKLRNGVPVQINNTVMPAANSAPKPANT